MSLSTRSRLVTTAVAMLTLLFVSPTFGQREAPEDRLTGPERARIAREVERLIPIQQRHQNSLLDRARVHGMGITLDPDTREAVFEIAVERGGLLPELPSRIEGVPVRVVRQDPPMAMNGGSACQPCHANQLPLPVQMGNSTGNGQSCFACTLGFKVCKDGVDYYVTNAHCSPSSLGCVGGAPIGSTTFHRGQLDASCSTTSAIGTVSQHESPVCNGTNNRVDGALVRSTDSQTQWSIRDIGTPSKFAGTATVGMGVRKSGRTTGYTYGTVASVNYTSNVTNYGCCGTARFVGQIKVNASAAPFIQPGDSGSALLDYSSPSRVVGLLFAGPADGSYGIANKIQDVLSDLGDVSLDPSCTAPTCEEECAEEYDECDARYCSGPDYDFYRCEYGCDYYYEGCMEGCGYP